MVMSKCRYIIWICIECVLMYLKFNQRMLFILKSMCISHNISLLGNFFILYILFKLYFICNIFKQHVRAITDGGFYTVLSDGFIAFNGCFLHHDHNYIVRPLGRRKPGCRGIYENTVVRLKKIQKLKINNVDKMMILDIEVVSHNNKGVCGILGNPISH